MSSGAKRAGSDRVEGVPLRRKPYGTYKEFRRKDYLPAEFQVRRFLEEVAYTGDLQLSYRAQWLLARFWRAVLPEAAKRLTRAMRHDLKGWVAGSSIEDGEGPPRPSPGR